MVCPHRAGPRRVRHVLVSGQLPSQATRSAKGVDPEANAGPASRGRSTVGAVSTLADKLHLTAGVAERPGVRRFDVVLVATGVALALAGAVSVVMPALDARVVSPSLDLVLDTVTTFVAASVAALAWIRYRQRDEPVALYQAAAFLVLGITNGMTVLLTVSGLDGRVGATLAAPGQGPIYVFVLARFVAAVLLVAGSWDALRQRRPRHPGLLLAGSLLATAAILLLLALPAGVLPAIGTTPTGPLDAAGNATGAPTLTLLGGLACGAGAGVYLWAAALSRQLYRRDGGIGDAFLSIGLVFAGFAQIATVTDPGIYSGLVTAGDVLRLAFDVILVLGIQAQLHASLGELRDVNTNLGRLRTVEVERAAQAERVRLSRELHDGLAQNLWLAKLKAGRLAAIPGLGAEATALTEELDLAIEAGLVEAQQAVAALRMSSEHSGTLRELLSRTVDDFADRFGLRVQFECPEDLPSLTPSAQVEALRIAQEALTNVRRHADATVVHVKALIETGRLVVAVADNGRGFDIDAVGDSAYGLAGMRERAGLIGGELRLVSAPLRGTVVSLVVPLSLVAAAVPVSLA